MKTECEDKDSIRIDVQYSEADQKALTVARNRVDETLVLLIGKYLYKVPLDTEGRAAKAREMAMQDGSYLNAFNALVELERALIPAKVTYFKNEKGLASEGNKP